MTNHEIRNIEDGLALLRQLAKQHFQSTVAMVVSAALGFFLTSVAAPEINGLGLAIAAATGLSVGVWCQPNVYRRRNGSLTLAMVLIAGMWTVPVIVVLISFFG